MITGGKSASCSQGVPPGQGTRPLFLGCIYNATDCMIMRSVGVGERNLLFVLIAYMVASPKLPIVNL